MKFVLVVPPIYFSSPFIGRDIVASIFFLNVAPLTFYALHPHVQVFLEISCVVIPPPAACPEVEDAVVDAADISENPADDVVLVVHEAVLVAVVFAAASVPDVAELQASADIAAVFHVLIPVSVDAVVVDSLGHPRFLAVPNVGHYASSSSCAGVLD